MGGKNKNQRTKGNTRPCSSGRIAELLSASGTPVTCFVGFGSTDGSVSGSISSTGVSSPGSCGSNFPDESEPCLDPDLQLLLKKMTKKDSVTKLKSVQEFADVLKEKDEALVAGSVLPHWPRLYAKMALDSDCRVREASHRAHRQLVVKVGRKLAPHLRSLMGVWLVSQCDPYAPAASAAFSSLKAAFLSREKQAEAYAYCKIDVVNFIQDVLLQQTAQTISDPKLMTPEEMESKYNRIVVCCLDGLCILIAHLSEAQRDEISGSLCRIVSDDNFWKLRRNKDSRVQSAWFKLVACVCRNASGAVLPIAEKVSKAALGSLSTSDPLVVRSVWECALSVLDTMPDAWQHVNMRKMVQPQLWKVLREGGQGNATVVFPNMLLLLDRLPPDTNDVNFYGVFFSSMVQGMNDKRVVKSTSEMNAITQAYLECVQYVLVKHSELSDDNAGIHQLLITDGLLQLLQTSITDKTCRLSGSFYDGVGELVRYLSNRVHDSDANDPKTRGFENMLSLYWDGFFEFCENTLGVGGVQTEAWKLDRLADFFRALHRPDGTISKSETHVRFETDGVDKGRPVTKHIKTASLSVSHRCISSKTQQLSTLIARKLEGGMQLPYLKLLATVVTCAPSLETFAHLMSVQDEDTESEVLSARLFFDRVARDWLVNRHRWFETAEEKASFVSCVVDIVCALIGRNDEEAVEDALGALAGLDDPQVILLLFEKGVKDGEGSALRRWLKGGAAHAAVVRMSRRLLDEILSGKCTKKTEIAHCVWKVLQMCFRNLDSDPLITSSCISEVLEVFQGALTNPRSDYLPQSIEFSCDLALSLFRSYPACWELAGTEELLLTLFDISLHGTAPECLRTRVEEAWQVGVHHLLELKGGFLKDAGFFAESARHINAKLTAEAGRLGTEADAKHFVHVVSALLETVHRGASNPDDEVRCTLGDRTVLLLLDHMLPTDEQWKILDDSLPDACLVVGLVTGRFLFHKFPKATGNIPDRDFPASVCPQIAVAHILVRLLQEPTTSDADDNAPLVRPCPPEGRELLVRHLPHVLLAHGFCEGARTSLGRFQRRTSEEIRSFKDLLDTFSVNLRMCVDHLDLEGKLGLVDHVFGMAKADGWTWILALDSALKTAIDAGIRKVDLCQRLLLEELLPCRWVECIVALQCAVPFVSDDCKMKLLDTAINMLLCSEELYGANGTLGYLALVTTILRQVSSTAVFSMKEDITAVVEYVRCLKTNTNNAGCFDCDEAVASGQMDALMFCSQVCSFASAVLNVFPTVLTSEQWDFVLCSLTSWIECIAKHKQHLENTLAFASFAYQCVGLLEEVGCVVSSIGGSSPPESGEGFPVDLYTEWTEFFTRRIYRDVLLLFIYLAHLCTDDCMSTDLLTETVASALWHATGDVILELEVPAKDAVTAESETKDNAVRLPPRVESILRCFCPLLVHRNHCIQLGAHTVLRKIVASLPALAIEAKDAESERSGEDPPETLSPPSALVETLKETNAVVDAMLMEFSVGSCCIVQPCTDSYTYTLGYLLIWSHLSDFFSVSVSEDRSRFAAYFHESGLLSSLLQNLFKLMPVVDLVLSSPENKEARTTYFTEVPDLSPRAPVASSRLQHLACRTYLATLRKFPALVRQWWTSLDRVTADVVDRYTSRFASGIICTEEIKAVQSAGRDFSNMSVVVRPVAREVVATYAIDDATIELVVVLPANHPLGIVKVESRRKVKVGNAQWRNWMLQLTTFLMHQNGSVLDALSLWKRNVDKKFEGVEECMICFSVLHGSTCQLPRLTCRTCRKRFHSACLHKWFVTSNNSTCPLCRNMF